MGARDDGNVYRTQMNRILGDNLLAMQGMLARGYAVTIQLICTVHRSTVADI